MNVGATFIPDAQPPMLEEPRNGPLDDPAVLAQSTAVGRAPAGQHRENATPTQLTPVRLRIVGPVSLDPIGSPAGSSHFARDRGDRVDQRQQLRDVIAIGSRDLDRQGNATGIGDQMMLGTRFGSIRGIRPGLRPPKTARTESESTTAREKSIWSAPRKWLSKTRWTWFQTPAFCQSRRRRQQVMPLPQPISWGKSSHGMPVFSTKIMPVNTARLFKGFRPGCRNRLFFTGSRGAIRFHNRSSNSGLAISSSLSLSSREGVNHVARY
jgi:hypothetical protein